VSDGGVQGEGVACRAQVHLWSSSDFQSSPVRPLSSVLADLTDGYLKSVGTSSSRAQKIKAPAGHPPHPDTTACSARQRCRYLALSEVARLPLMRFDRCGDDPLA
jgi:hypothetical protein